MLTVNQIYNKYIKDIGTSFKEFYLTEIWEYNIKRPPVDFNTWINNKYLSGSVFQPLETQDYKNLEKINNIYMKYIEPLGIDFRKFYFTEMFSYKMRKPESDFTLWVNQRYSRWGDKAWQPMSNESYTKLENHITEFFNADGESGVNTETVTVTIKKPIYKRPLFWIILIIVLLIIFRKKIFKTI